MNKDAKDCCNNRSFCRFGEGKGAYENKKINKL
jgi:hypothetical protein